MITELGADLARACGDIIGSRGQESGTDVGDLFKFYSLRMCSQLCFFRDQNRMVLWQEWQVGAIITILMQHQRHERTGRPGIWSKHACFGGFLGLRIRGWWFLNECLWRSAWGRGSRQPFSKHSSFCGEAVYSLVFSLHVEKGPLLVSLEV